MVGRGGTTGGALGELLRGWRAARGWSQLDLALEAEVSQRHLSFIESGRSAPGRETLLGIAEALQVPLRERNELLLAAGYAPSFPAGGWDEPEMQSIVTAVRRMLRQQEPYPGLLMDRHWNVIETNAAAPRLFGWFVDMGRRRGPRNMLHLVFDPAGLRPFIREWGAVAASLLRRVRREAVGGVLDAGTRDLVVALLAYGDVPAERAPSGTAELPMIPIGFEKDGVALNYFSLVSTVGAPAAVLAQELRVECLFPADAATERWHRAMFADTDGAAG